ncbi:MAG: endonuclease/exonuclease/phosphatase family protein, partial [Chitinophagales bacterium]|nr:endonuclease/exonuclease/phosphatase family protein [Chitinophagales bacterium]
MSFIKKFFLFLNVITALCIVAGGMSIYINPTDFWVLSFFGLLYPAFLLLNIFFIFFWIIVRLQYVFISIVVIALTYPVLKTYFAFNFSSSPNKISSPQIKVMSYNVRNFDLYRWTKNKNTLDKMMELIANEDADVACFQEFYNADTGKFKTIKRLLDEAGFNYYHFEKTAGKKNTRGWGIATFSKYPIINFGAEKFENSKFNSAMYCD